MSSDTSDSENDSDDSQRSQSYSTSDDDSRDRPSKSRNELGFHRERPKKTRKSSHRRYQTFHKNKYNESGTSGEDSDSQINLSNFKRKAQVDVASINPKRSRNTSNTNNNPIRSSNADLPSDVDDYDDDMFLDEEDRIRLQLMSEKEREAEIFKRVEQREVLRARHAIQKKILAKKGDGDIFDKNRTNRNEKESNYRHEHSGGLTESFDASLNRTESKVSVKEKSGSATVRRERIDVQEEVDEYQRPSEVQRKEKKKSAMTDLLNRRNERREAEQKRKEKSSGNASEDVPSTDNSEEGEKSSISSRSTDRASSPDSSVKSDHESDIKKREVNCLKDIESIRLSRFKLSKFVHAPFFAKTIIGCFLRIGIGRHNGKSTYRAVQVADVVETSKVYSLESTATNRGVKVKHGKEERVFRLEYVSNNCFSQNEFKVWVDAMKAANFPLTTLDHVEKKVLDIKKAVNYNYTDKDIDLIIKEKARFKKTPLNYAFEKGLLMRLKQEAEQDGKIHEIQTLQQKIDYLDNKAAELDKQRTQSTKGISWINARNKEAMKNYLFTEQSHSTTTDEYDPFTRKNTRTRLTIGREKRLPAQKVAPAISIDLINSKRVKEKCNPNELAKTTANSIANRESSINDLFKAHNFDVDIDIVIPTSSSSLSSSLNPLSASLASTDTGRDNYSMDSLNYRSKSLTLEEYRQRKSRI